MIEEEFQDLLLKELKGINSRLGSLETKVDRLETKVNSLEIKVDSLETKVNSLEIKVDSLKTKVNSLEIKVDSLETKVDSLETKVEGLEVRLGRIEDRQQEQQDILGALLHNQEFANAELEQLKVAGVNRESIRNLVTKDDLKASMQALNNRMFNQEVEVEKLKLVK